MPLRLRPLRADDERQFVAAHKQLAGESVPFGLAYELDVAWDDYVQTLEDHRNGINLPERFVPSTFLIADVGGEIVGRTSIRHRLNDFLAREGGHIGYAVLPQHRLRGYAIDILQQSLVIARSVGIDRVLVTCDETNVGSQKVIERCGGRYESSVVPEAGGVPKRRYWID